MSVYVTDLPVCLLCRPAYLSTLPTCLSVYIADLPTCLPCLPADLLSCLPADLPPADLPTCRLADLPSAYLPAYLPTCHQTRMNTLPELLSCILDLD